MAIIGNKDSIGLSKKEEAYLLKRYSRINYDDAPMYNFLSEIYKIIKFNVLFEKDAALLDIGCGRGYFLKYLQQQGHRNICGIDPCKPVLDEKIFNNIRNGSYEDNCFKDNEFDIVIACHTLHHLREGCQLAAVREMARISKKYIIIVEINNTNIPIFLFSVLNIKVEKRAFTYNRYKVEKILKMVGLRIVYSKDLDSLYLSGNSILFQILYRLGARPYNIVIAQKGSVQ